MDKSRIQTNMPDVPKQDFTDALCEIWSGLNYAAYHLAYVRVYSQTAALQTSTDQLRMGDQPQPLRNTFQVDVIVCRAHLAAFFWQLDHVFEALEAAIPRGQMEYSTNGYFWSREEHLKEIKQTPIYQEIHCYRNKGHELPGIIGCAWDKGSKFLHHFLPSIFGQEPKDSIDMNVQLRRYFEFVANLWLSFVPENFKDKFPRSFKFPVTIPYSYLGELPSEVKGVPQLEVSIEASDRENVSVADARVR